MISEVSKDYISGSTVIFVGVTEKYQVGRVIYV